MSRPDDLRTFVTEETQRIRATPEVVMARLRSPDDRATWQSEIVWLTGPDGLSVGDSVEGVADMLGFLVEGKATTTELGPAQYEEDVIVGVRMRIRFELTPDGDGVIVKHVLTSKLPGGLAGRVLSSLLKGPFTEDAAGLAGEPEGLRGVRAAVLSHRGHGLHQVPDGHDADRVVVGVDDQEVTEAALGHCLHSREDVPTRLAGGDLGGHDLRDLRGIEIEPLARRPEEGRAR